MWDLHNPKAGIDQRRTNGATVTSCVAWLPAIDGQSNAHLLSRANGTCHSPPQGRLQLAECSARRRPAPSDSNTSERRNRPEAVVVNGRCAGALRCSRTPVVIPGDWRHERRAQRSRAASGPLVSAPVFAATHGPVTFLLLDCASTTSRAINFTVCPSAWARKLQIEYWGTPHPSTSSRPSSRSRSTPCFTSARRALSAEASRPVVRDAQFSTHRKNRSASCSGRDGIPRSAVPLRAPIGVCVKARAGSFAGDRFPPASLVRWPA
jgi:hypothetical protein